MFRRQQPPRPVRPGRGRKKKKMPDWDSTVSDLSALKATPEEIRRRREAHMSANLELVKQQEKIKAARLARQKMDDSSHLLREVLLDQSQLEETLTKTDKALAVVKDLFGDNPMPYKAVPTVTTAPRKRAQNDAEQKRLEALLPAITDEPTELDRLSESVHDKTALNEMVSESSEGEESDKENIDFKSGMDLRRFRRFLEEEEAVTDPSRLEDTSLSKIEAGPCAINDTAKITRTKSRLTEADSANSSTRPTSSTNFSQGLGAIDAQLHLLSERRNVNNSSNINNNNSTTSDVTLTGDSYTGYADAVMEAIARISSYLKETEEILISETNLRQQLMEEVADVRRVTEVLKNEVATVRGNQTSFEEAFRSHQEETRQQFNYLVSLIRSGQTPSPQESGRETMETVTDTTPCVSPEKLITDSPTVDDLASQMTDVLSAVPSHLRHRAIPLSPPRQAGGTSGITDRLNEEPPSPMSNQIARLGQEHLKAQDRLQQLQHMFGTLESSATFPDHTAENSVNGTQQSNAKNKYEFRPLREPSQNAAKVHSSESEGSVRNGLSDLRPLGHWSQSPEFHAQYTGTLANQRLNNASATNGYSGLAHPALSLSSNHGVKRFSHADLRPGLSSQNAAPSMSQKSRNISTSIGHRMNSFGAVAPNHGLPSHDTVPPTSQNSQSAVTSGGHDINNVGAVDPELDARDIARQIELLTMEHSAASNKLQQIIDKQRSTHLEKEKSRVSPSISPIPPEIPEKDNVQWGTPTKASANKKSITVSVPQVDNVSMTTTPSPHDMRSVSKLAPTALLPGEAEQNFLGLAAHIRR